MAKQNAHEDLTIYLPQEKSRSSQVLTREVKKGLLGLAS